MEAVIPTQNDAVRNDEKSGTITKAKNPSLQGLRAVAILAIFVFHAGIGRFSALGAWSVSVFFVLSGFLMIYNYLPRDTMPRFGFAFAWSKIKRLYPLHMITMLLVALYTVITTGVVGKTLLDMGIHTLLIQTWIPNSEYYATLNGPAWYLCASFFLYLMFPLILQFFKKTMSKKKAVCCLCGLFVVEILISLIAVLLHHYGEDPWFSAQWLTYYFPPVRLIDFFAGCCLGYLFLKRGQRKKNYALEFAVCVLTLISILIYTFQYGILGSEPFKSSLLFLPTTIMLLWVVANEKGVISKILSTKLCVWLGDLSPFIFLIHWAVIKYCRTGFAVVFSMTNPYVIAAVSLVVTIIGAVLWRKFDKYLQERSRKHKQAV